MCDRGLTFPLLDDISPSHVGIHARHCWLLWMGGQGTRGGDLIAQRRGESPCGWSIGEISARGHDEVVTDGSEGSYPGAPPVGA